MVDHTAEAWSWAGGGSADIIKALLNALSWLVETSQISWYSQE